MMSELTLKQARINEESVISEVGQPSEVSTPSHLAGRYRFVREIGHGSQGKVFLAVRLSDNQRVVIKQLSIGSVKNWKEYTLFKREGEVLSGLDIDGVARFYEAPEFLEDDQPCAYIVQEYICGETLKSRLDKGSRLTVDDVYDIAVQLLNILDKLHHHDPPVIHRDIKPSNIILEQKPGGYKVHLIDFGAVSNPQIQGGGSTVAGTYGYMPPEQLMGNPKPGSDIYALGATIVYMLGGVSPETLPNKDFRLIFEPELQHVPDDVVKTLRQMLEPNIQNRLCDYLALIKCFSNYKKHCYGSKQSDSLANAQTFDMTQYNKDLLSVGHYGDAGNIELWSKLSETTPREIPKSYIDSIDRIKQLYVNPVRTSVPFVFSTFTFIGEVITNVILTSYFTSFFILCISIPFFGQYCVYEQFYSLRHRIVGIILITILEIWLGYNIIGSIFFDCSIFPGLLLGIYCVLWTFIMFMEMKEFFCTYNKLKNRIRSYVNKHYLRGTEFYNKRKNLLIAQGRKSIARIVSVKYMQIAPEMTNEVIAGKEKEFSESDDYAWTEKKLTPIYYGIPTFKITYAFNPPDDLRSEDIIHEFYAHQDPGEHLKPGDVLPIIYMIDHLGQPGETVYSMPFPLVLNDPVNLKDIIACSGSNNDQVMP